MKVTIPALNDSKLIGISVYNVVIMSTIGVAVNMIIRDKPSALYIFTASIVMFCATLTISIVFIPKVRILWLQLILIRKTLAYWRQPIAFRCCLRCYSLLWWYFVAKLSLKVNSSLVFWRYMKAPLSSIQGVTKQEHLLNIVACSLPSYVSDFMLKKHNLSKSAP